MKEMPDVWPNVAVMVPHLAQQHRRVSRRTLKRPSTGASSSSSLGRGLVPCRDVDRRVGAAQISSFAASPRSALAVTCTMMGSTCAPAGSGLQPQRHLVRGLPTLVVEIPASTSCGVDRASDAASVRRKPARPPAQIGEARAVINDGRNRHFAVQLPDRVGRRAERPRDVAEAAEQLVSSGAAGHVGAVGGPDQHARPEVARRRRQRRDRRGKLRHTRGVGSAVRSACHRCSNARSSASARSPPRGVPPMRAHHRRGRANGARGMSLSSAPATRGRGRRRRAVAVCSLCSVVATGGPRPAAPRRASSRRGRRRAGRPPETLLTAKTPASAPPTPPPAPRRARAPPRCRRARRPRHRDTIGRSGRLVLPARRDPVGEERVERRARGRRDDLPRLFDRPDGVQAEQQRCNGRPHDRKRSSPAVAQSPSGGRGSPSRSGSRRRR